MKDFMLDKQTSDLNNVDESQSMVVKDEPMKEVEGKKADVGKNNSDFKSLLFGGSKKK